MSELLAVDKEKGLRKRRSTTAIREEDGSQKKVAHAPGGKGEETGDITKMMTTKIRSIIEARYMDEQKARDDGLRVEKKTRMRPQFVCYVCEEISGVNHNTECLVCGHCHCPECIIKTQQRMEHLAIAKLF